ncbi:MAG: hypothetical protein IJH50_06970 [Kiritimatiellae bacterium]|nr:hypothetical protein [Kiritimatiellia bacterium]
MKKSVCLIVIASALAGMANNALPDDEGLRRTGGSIEKPGSQKGEIVYVNCQGAAKAEWIASSIDYFTKQTKFKITLRDGEFSWPSPKIHGSLSLFIVDDEGLPTILCAPENRWAVVNVAPLKSGKEAFFEARIKKELTRGFAYLCGAANSRYPNALTGGITSVDMIDKITDARLPADVIERFRKYVESFGVTPIRYTAYINACRQGWAPPPTNDYQKAIWDKVHAIPAKPMKIEFDPKKGR